MRSISPTNAAAIGQPHTEPIFLLDLGLQPSAILLSTKGPTTFGNPPFQVTYEQGYLEIHQLKWNPDGSATAVVGISSAFKDEAISGGIIDTPFVLSMTYNNGTNIPFSDFIELLRGTVQDSPIERLTITLRCARLDSETLRLPFLEYEHQNIQPPGTKITINNNTIVIERADTE